MRVGKADERMVLRKGVKEKESQALRIWWG
jgi:hypothetical protein